MNGPAPLEAAQPPKRDHLVYVEGMRAAAALVVFVNHAYAQARDPITGRPPDGVFSIIDYSLVAGHLAVVVFIVISGFCLALPAVASGDRIRGGTVSFFKRRAKRILPPYYAAVAFSLLLIGTVLGKPTGSLWDVPIQVTPVSIVSHVLLLQDFFATGSINYVFWSIAVEWQIYFLFPALLWSLRRFGLWRATLSAIVLSYGVRLLVEGTRVARANPHFIGMFMLGMAAAYVGMSQREELRKWREQWPFKPVALVCLAVAVGLTLYLGVEQAIERFFVLDLPVGVVTACCLVLAARSRDSLIRRSMSVQPLALLGTFSYSLYLVHAPLLQILWQFLLYPAKLSPNAIFVALMTGGLALVIGFSYLFFRLFEAPFMTKTPRPAAATAPPALS